MSTPTIERHHPPGQAPAQRSAYPSRVAALLPKARALATELGEVPSRNRLMSQLRVGAPKATELRTALLDGDPAGQGTGRRPAPDRAPPDPAPAPTPPAVPAWGESGHAAAPAPVPAREPTPGEPGTEPAEPGPVGVGPGLATAPAHPDPAPEPAARRVPVWPVLLLAAPAFVAIWSGWVGLGQLTGFGTVRPLPGIWDSLTLNTAITLPIGVETYAAYALRAWLTPGVPPRARRFARASAIGALCLGALGQIAYHLMAAAEVTAAPWQITTLVSCLPVAVLGMGAALIHLLQEPTDPATDSEALR